MIKEMVCYLCGVPRPMELVRSTETIEIHQHKITFEAEFYRCPVCGEEIEDLGQVDRNLAAAREVYDRLYATPTASELVVLREKYNISQKSLSTLLGFGETTMNSYESGASVPQPPNRLLLKLVENPTVFREIYRLNKDKLSALQRRKIEDSVGWAEAKATYMVTVSNASGQASTTSGASTL